jgi:hypothetical protein
MTVTEEVSNTQTNNTLINQSNLERDKWASHEFGNALLGDPRRTERLIKIAKERAAKPSCPLPQCFDDQAELKAAYRFYDK